LPPNSNYTMDGTESYVNSGFIFPVGQAPPGMPPISTFTVTFEKPGTYEYLCALHPWMTGTVSVR
jgi:hypothetical protein